MANRILFPVFLFLSILSATSFSQSPPTPPLPGDTTWVEGDDAPIFTTVTQMPNDTELLRLIRSNLSYSEGAKCAGTEGTVYIKFIIEQDGRVTHVTAQNEIDGIGGVELVKNAVFAVESLGKVQPAFLNGTPVRLERTLPISFSLSGWGDNPQELPYCTSLKDAKETIQCMYYALSDEYNRLCGYARNGTTREQFVALSKKIKDFQSLGGSCQMLSASKQKRVNKYAKELLDSSGMAILLESGKIPCWE